MHALLYRKHELPTVSLVVGASFSSRSQGPKVHVEVRILSNPNIYRAV